MYTTTRLHGPRLIFLLPPFAFFRVPRLSLRLIVFFLHSRFIYIPSTLILLVCSRSAEYCTTLSLEAASYESFSSAVQFRRFRHVSSMREVCIMNINYLFCSVYSRVVFFRGKRYVWVMLCLVAFSMNI